MTEAERIRDLTDRVKARAEQLIKNPQGVTRRVIDSFLGGRARPASMEYNCYYQAATEICEASVDWRLQEIVATPVPVFVICRLGGLDR